MPFLELLFSFHGRITAARFRRGGTISGLLLVVLFCALTGAVLNLGAAADVQTKVAVLLIGWSALALFTVWSNAALQAKRLHDRGRTGYLALIPVFIFLIWGGILVYVASVSLQTEGGALAAPANFLSVLEQFGNILVPLGGVSSLVSLWVLIDLGWLPGTPGPNQFGPESGSPQMPDDPKATPRKSWFAPNQATNASMPSWDVSGAVAAIAKSIDERNSKGGALAAETWKENAQPQLSNVPERRAFGRKI